MMETIGYLFLLVRSPPDWGKLTGFQIDGKSLTASEEDGAGLTVLEPHGFRSVELLAAVARLTAMKRLAVDMQLAPSGLRDAAAAVQSAPPPPFPPQPAPQPALLPDGTSLIQVALNLPRELWSCPEQQARDWLGRGRRAAVALLGAIVPLAEDAAEPLSGEVPGGARGGGSGSGSGLAPEFARAVREAVEDLLEQDGDRDRYSLLSCFRELPSVTQRGSPAAATARPPSYDGAARAPFLELPRELLEGIFCRMEPLDLARLRATCRRMAEEGDQGGAVPGLRLTLFPHQRAALGWMVRQERRPAQPPQEGPRQGQQQQLPPHSWPRPDAHSPPRAPQSRRGAADGGTPQRRRKPEPSQPQQQHPDQDQQEAAAERLRSGRGQGSWSHPQYVELRSSGGRALWADLGSGELYTSRPSEAARVRGGFFCDEPGLGKTITAISLVLKTIGQLPAAPPGANVTWTSNRDKRPVAYYSLGGGGGSAGPVSYSSAGPVSYSSAGDAKGSASGGSGDGAGAAGGAAGSSNGGGGERAAGAGCTTNGSMDAAAAARVAAAMPEEPSPPPGRTGASPRGMKHRPSPAPAARATVVVPDAGVVLETGAGGASPVSPRRVTRAATAAAAAAAAVAPAEPSALAAPMKPEAEGAGGASQTPQPEALQPTQPPPAPQQPPQPQPPQQARQPPARKRVRFAGADDSDDDEKAKEQEQPPKGLPAGSKLSFKESAPPPPAAAVASGGGVSPVRNRKGVTSSAPTAAPTAAAAAASPRPAASPQRRYPRGTGAKQGSAVVLPARGKGGGSGAAEEAAGAHGRRGRGVRGGGKRRRGGGRDGRKRRRRGAAGWVSSSSEESEDSDSGSEVDGASDGGAEAGCEADDCGRGDGDGEESTWIQCEDCRAWRKLPDGASVPANGPWFCHMHPVPHLASCSAPPDGCEADEVCDSAPGYLRPGEAPYNLENVSYFEATLRAVASRMKRGDSCVHALRWLCDLDPARLASDGPGVQLPSIVRDVSNGYAAAFRACDLQRVPLARSPRGAGKGAAGSGAGGQGQGKGPERRRAAAGGGGGGGGRAGQHTWRAAPYVKGLVLDVQALAKAVDHLMTGTGPTRTFLSPATLVVLPPTIIDHWLLQIQKHVAPRTLRVCVLDRFDPRHPPSAAELAWDYDIVITTFNCLSQAKAGDKKEGLSRLSQLLLEVHWLRVILDEGHLLGASTAITNKQQMACRLVAERRWVMTGTPTPATSSSSAAAHLQPLLAFLHHEPYGKNSVTWQSIVQRPLEACRPEGRRRLMRLLLENMIRASKADLVKLPRLTRRRVVLDFEPQHAASYNELVEVVRRNLLTSDWCDEDHRESLLSTRNSRWSRQMMNNVWLSCCVAGSTNSVVKEEDLLETLELLAGRLGLPAPGAELPGGVAVGPPWLSPSHPLWGTEEGLRHGACCQVCSEFVRQPMVTPCGHLVCLDCTATDRESCPLPSCRTPYVMQAVDDPARSKQNKKPKWPVPKELIEWQPVYHQQGAQGIDGGTWSASWHLTRSSKISYMLRRLREVGAAPESPPPPLPPTTTAAAAAASKTTATSSSPMRDAAESRPPSPPAAAGDGGSGSDSAGDEAAAAKVASPPLRPYIHVKAKAIVFTQFGLHLQLIEASLMQAGIPFSILARVLNRSEREEALTTFQHDPCCGVLVMDQVGAVGLDLSFASYILLMEPLEDSSLEEQVVSRAHRMGAVRDVVVETVVMRGSAEEALLSIDRRMLPLTSKAAGAPAVAAAAASDAAAPPTAVAATNADVAPEAEAGQGAGSGSGSSRGSGRGTGGSRASGCSQPRAQEGEGDRGRGGSMAAAATEEHENDGGVQVDRRALRNRLFLLLEKVRLRSAHAATVGAAGTAGAAGGSGARRSGIVGGRLGALVSSGRRNEQSPEPGGAGLVGGSGGGGGGSGGGGVAGLLAEVGGAGSDDGGISDSGGGASGGSGLSDGGSGGGTNGSGGATVAAAVGLELPPMAAAAAEATASPGDGADAAGEGFEGGRRGSEDASASSFDTVAAAAMAAAAAAAAAAGDYCEESPAPPQPRLPEAGRLN